VEFEDFVKIWAQSSRALTIDRISQYNTMEVSLSRSHHWPPWVNTLLNSQFFCVCSCQESSNLRAESRERSTNYLNIVGCSIHCSCCCPPRSLQVRRNTHANSIRAEDLAPLISIEGIQVYSNNQAKCIFIHPRDPPSMDSSSASANMAGRCTTCSRKLMDSDSLFCSLGCKTNSQGCSFSLPSSFTQIKVSTANKEEELESEGEPLFWPVGSKRSRYAQTSVIPSIQKQSASLAIGLGKALKKKSKPSRANFE
jgi:hypothetical protein